MSVCVRLGLRSVCSSHKTGWPYIITRRTQQPLLQSREEEKRKENGGGNSERVTDVKTGRLEIKKIKVSSQKKPENKLAR